MSANTKVFDKPLLCVVDDDSLIRDSTVRLLRSFGFRVEAFASAEDFGNSVYLEETACLLLDVQLPVRSGLDLQQELAIGDAQIPIIFMTGHGDIPMSVRAMKAGLSNFSRNLSATKTC
jgi:FixJ family two-component response regulator